MTLSLLSLVTVAIAGHAISEPTSYRITPDSQAQVRFTVDAPLDSIVGVSHGVSGKIDYDPDTKLGTAEISADLGSFRTGISLRDEDLRDRFFEMERFPKATLKVQRVVPSAEGTRGAQIAVGTLSLHGVEHVVRVPISIENGTREGHVALTIRGSFEVTFADYNIQRPKVLFLKLGDRARVDVQAMFIGPEVDRERVVASTLQEIKPMRPLFQRGDFVPVAHVPKVRAQPARQRFQFAANTAEGRGERMLEDATLGGHGNAVTCVSCHSTKDERFGMLTDGVVPPNRTLFDSAHRASLWQGLAPTPGKAAALCVRLFMLGKNGLKPDQEKDFAAYLKAISPDDAMPALDYKVMAFTRTTGLPNPTGGDRKLGAALEKRFCEGCHAAGKVRPPLTAGLYEPEYLVKRVRWLPGHDARQMPPIYADRLPDSDLRNIVTYLAGDESQKIFQRKNAGSTRVGVR